MKSLYEINQDLYNVMQEAALEASESDGEISDIIGKKLDALNQERSVKIGNVCRFYKSLLGEAAMVKEEAAALTERAKATANKAESLKNYLGYMMKPGEEYSDTTSKVSWRASKSLVVDEDAAIPKKFQRITIEPDKKGLKEAIESGKKFKGIFIDERNNINIK